MRVFLSVVLLLALAVAALPLWFPWALRPIAKRFGATYAHYQRLGYDHFQLSDFALTNGVVQVTADKVKTVVPTVWLWRHLNGKQNEPFVEVQSWKYATAETKSTRTQVHAPVSVRDTFQTVRNIAEILQNWLPTATLSNGTVSIGKEDLKLALANWTNGNLTATVSLTNGPALKVVAATKPGSPWTMNIAAEPQSLHSTFSIADREGQLAVTGTVNWLTNRFDVAATFPPRGFIPDTASVRADAFAVPARLIGMPEYGNIGGSVQATWQTNRFTVQLAAKASSTSTNLPPFNVQLGASGDTNAARLDTADISIPGLQAGLSAPVAIRFQPPFLSQPAKLDLAADLDRQHWFVGQGRLTGSAMVYPGEKFPRVSVTLAGAGVTTTSVTTSNLSVDGELNWPVLELKTARAEMDDGSRISLSGKYNFAEKAIQDGRVNFSGAFGGQYLPADYSFNSATLTAQFGGPLDALTNSASLQVKQVAVPHMNPVDIAASWAGEGLNFKTVQVAVKTGAASLLLRGSTQLTHGEKTLNLTALELSESNRTELRLQDPVRIAFGSSPNNAAGSRTNATWSLSVGQMSLTGDGREFRLAANVNWPERGSVQTEARSLDVRLLKDFIPSADAEAVLNHLNFVGGWTNGPVVFQLASDATLKTKEQLPFSADAKLTGGKDGIAIEQLSISSATQMVSRVEGSLPVFFNPAGKNGLMQIDADKPLKLQASTDPRSILWEKIAEATGLRLEEPNLTANLEGTWAAPKGQVAMRVQRLEIPIGERPLPPIENVDFLMVMDRATARVSRFNFEIDKQPVRLTGEVPLGESFWTGLRHERHLPDWREAKAHLQIENAQLAPFTSLLPQILSPEGNASADIALEPGGNLHGELSVTNARTHPLESVGPVRNIQLLARLDGRNVRLEHASGEIGGQRVNLDGGMELNEQAWRTNGLPTFQVHLSGTNVPLARNPSVLLRADVDLSVTNSGAEIPIVYGKVKLRDSLFLADLQALVPERTASARKRPPYFSVEAEPWAHWRLNVNVQGDKFLRVQTPLFHGTVSTVLTLEGTMKDPLALGQVKIDSGSSISFPFSSLDVKQGFILLTSEDPYRPNLFVTAEARRFGYDVKMEASGPADQPVVQFSSIPGLSSEEIVLMLTTGQIPRGLGVTATTQERAQGLALFVGKNLLSDFGLGGGGADRLTVRSGQEISESGRPTYDIEYKLTDRWSVIGEYDRFDQYNLNIKYKLYSK
ncbi:MAG TPA: translocation/assembly module TamB domain-containing protein [Verrucomicrobiae bacterium]|nr:translocation/assembly module TamB domain-containing protein [Verrucomicrobiae bacterium]